MEYMCVNRLFSKGKKILYLNEITPSLFSEKKNKQNNDENIFKKFGDIIKDYFGDNGKYMYISTILENSNCKFGPYIGEEGGLQTMNST